MYSTPSISEMKNEALSKLEGQWGNGAISYLVMIILLMIPFASFFISGPLQLGIAGTFLKVSRGGKAEINDLFDGFRNFGNAFLLYLLMSILIIIGVIFLIVPGIIIALALSQSYRILKDNPEINAIDAMQRSFDLMKGHKGDYFVLTLSFIGWAILCLFTLGIGFLFLAPYYSTTSSVFYNHITNYKDQELEQLATEVA
ncbi:MAG: DUF975 family protein [Chitinophagaceae bacterium]|nr:DUF975 family protein [Chitinophagaceae bacterium]